MMKRIVALALLLSGPVIAQVRPIPSRTPGSPSSSVLTPSVPARPSEPPRKALPAGPIQIAKLPRIALIGAPPAVGRETTLRFLVSNLGDARAVHLFAFQPGCDFEQKGGISGLPLRLDIRTLGLGSTRAYSSSWDRRFGDSRPIELPGIPVANGAAEVMLIGVTGASGGRFTPDEEVSGPSFASLMERDALARYQRTITSDTQCEPKAYVMVQGADSQWRLLNRDGSFNDTFRTDGTAAMIIGQPFTPRPRRKVAISATGSLKSLLAPAIRANAPGSVCEGTSSALGGQDHAVGVIDKEGDIAFRIRSGPNGTRCIVAFPDAALPAGVTALNARFSVARTGDKCRLGNGGVPLDPGILAGLIPGASFALERSSQMLMRPQTIVEGAVNPGSTGWLNPFAMPSEPARFNWSARIAPMLTGLFCEATATNDHGIELRLDSIEFLVPEGVAFP